ncbi:hypothetical protein E2L08_04630 [Palleronia sediminis]|uniref:Haem-binding uptake Tiki superfamily ChaN domain-containing protein n=1 Tax=Palleronia sediminis TaxID=2547833 RepID=A0A4R6AKE2_9RHOB|nr:ChaN family lipoprotein [Palleronia sediminis]TDL81943.1 hypothetical protein E2L08_04630 [Palleronia sediminis]
MLRLTALCGAILFGVAPAVFSETAADAIPLDAQIVVMGEEHDAPAHHRNQAELIRRMGAGAVVFEMLPEALGPVATRHAGEPADALAARLEWSARGWPDFAIYAPVFAAAHDVGATIHGAEVARDDLRRALDGGAAAAFGTGAARFGLDRALPRDALAGMTAEIAAAHCDLLPETALPGMVEAQRLRDAALAAAAVAAFEAGQHPVAIVTGNGHARRDRGVPALVRQALPEISITAIGQFTEPPEDAPPYDAWLVTEAPPERPVDPCAPLR